MGAASAAAVVAAIGSGLSPNPFAPLPAPPSSALEPVDETIAGAEKDGADENGAPPASSSSSSSSSSSPPPVAWYCPCWMTASWSAPLPTPPQPPSALLLLNLQTLVLDDTPLGDSYEVACLLAALVHSGAGLGKA